MTEREREKQRCGKRRREEAGWQGGVGLGEMGADRNAETREDERQLREMEGIFKDEETVERVFIKGPEGRGRKRKLSWWETECTRMTASENRSA